ncbi:MAG: hypothetical protein KF764_18860 [Labilithrix sp.]|nr:hypothetical protein [Labilithrix sp.]
MSLEPQQARPRRPDGTRGGGAARRRCGARALVAAGVLAATVATGAHAGAQSNYRSAPVGGRSQLLGGTGMTYGRDAAAAFLNPATAVLVDDERLSFSVNFYTVSYVYAPRWFVPGPIDRGRFGALDIDDAAMTDLEFNALPSSLCLFFRMGDVKFLARAQKDPRTREARLGLCFATISSQSFDFAAEGFSETRSPSVTRQAQTLAQRYTRFAVGPTYAMHVSNALAVGASFHASLANHRSLLAATATTYGSSPSAINSMFYSGSRGDSFQLDATVGATLRFGKQTVGMSVRSPSVHVFGVGGANRQSYFDGAGSEAALVSAQGSFVSRSPPRLALGTGIEGTWGLAELDTSYHLPIDAYSAELEGHQVTTRDGTVDDQRARFALTERARGVVNVAAGAELFVSPRLSVLTGLSTDFSAVPQGALEGGSLFNYYPHQTHRVAGSFGVSSHGTGGELLVGAELSAGWGQRLAVNSYQLPPTIGTTGHGTYQLMLVVAGSTSLRAIKRAVEDVREVITTPKPRAPAQPAKPAEPYNPRTLEEERRREGTERAPSRD